MEFRVLGPLEVMGADGPIVIRSARQRAVLAILVLHPGETLSSDRLVDEVWGDDPPPSARHTLAVHVSGLRQALGADRIETHPNGYRLSATEATTDLGQFEALVAEAAQASAAGTPALAAKALTDGLALWRGHALADLAGTATAQAERARLDEFRALATDRWIDAELACGRHLALVPELRRIVAEMPLQESFQARLMVALYRSGRQAEALEVYRAARALLDEELGVDPGAELEAAQLAVLEHHPSLDAPRPSTSPSLGADPRSPLRATRRTITILVAELDATSIEGSPLDAEAQRLLRDRWLETARPVLERHGGTVERSAGEALVAVFGVPTMHEDDALRGVRAAVEMRGAVRAQDRPLEGPSVRVRIGLDTGEVVAGGTSDRGRLASGDAMTTASRLQQAAAWDQILLADATWWLVRDAVRAGPAMPIRMTGSTRPIRARLLEDVTGSEGHRRRLDAPIVGRRAELAALDRALDQAIAARSCVLFTVLGAAGIGKSRLAAEFMTSARSRAAVLDGRCLPYGDGATYWPLAEIVREAAGIEAADPADLARTRISALATGLTDAGAVVNGLAGLLGLDSPATGDEIAWAVRTLLEHLSRNGPLVVVVDDVHWAEAVLVDLLESVADLVREAPILLVCTARPEFLDDRPTWAGGKLHATTILLDPLPEESAKDLLAALVPGGPLAESVLACILDAAEGNPLFVEEFLGMLIDEGALESVTEGWRATRDLTSIAVPATIEALLAARLDQLGSEECAVAERASVVGRSFEQSAVIALSPVERQPHVRDDLVALVRNELIRPDRSGAAGRDGFRFRHMLIRDAAYARLPKAERAELHERFAGWLDGAAEAHGVAVDELVGHHLDEARRYRVELGRIDDRTAGLAARAAERLIAAGRRAWARSDAGATIRLLQRADALLGPDDPARDLLMPDLGRAFAENGRRDDAHAFFRAAEARAVRHGDERLLAHALVALQGFGPQDPAETSRIAGAAVAVFERIGDDQGLAAALVLLANALNEDGRLADEVALNNRALQHARRAGDRNLETSIVFDLGFDLLHGPTPVPAAIERCEEIIRGAPDDRAVELAMSHPLAHFYARLGDFGRARRLAGRVQEILLESGQLVLAAVLSEIAWDVETLAGDHVAAERSMVDGCARLVAVGQSPALHLGFLARSRAALGHPIDVPALEAVATPERGWVRAVLDGALALGYLQAGDFQAGERAVRRALDYLAASEFITLHGDASLILGDVLRASDREAEARLAYAEAGRLYDRKGSVVGASVALARIAPA